MGVRGLEKFLQDQVANGVFSINILDEIERKKSEDPEKPIISAFQVIDILYNISLKLKKFEAICGASHKKIHDIFDKSFQKLKNVGVDLHFFIDGPVPNYDLKTWTDKQTARYNDNIALINAIDSNVPIEETKEMDKQPGATTPFIDLRRICEKYGTWHVPLTSRCMVDIVKYSNENDVLAIVANNSNFLIFNGKWRYWSCRDLGLIDQNWNTLEYNKSALVKHIGLSQSQMPMLAAISGNDFVAYDKVRALHKKIHGGQINYFEEHFPILAERVQNFPCPLSYEEKREFTLDLFESSDFHHYKMVCDSFNFYATKTEANEEIDSLLVAAASFDRIYYNSLTEAPIRMNLPSFYDLRRTDFLPYFKIELPILKRQIGFVRKHKNDVNYKHSVAVKLSHSEPHRCISVAPEYPIVEILDLEDLTFNKANGYFNNVRFKILKWMIFGNDCHPQFLIKNIPAGYMVAVVTIMHLVKKLQLSRSCNLIEVVTSDKKPSRRFSFDGVYFVYWFNEIKTNDHNATLSKIKNLKDFLQFVTD